MALWISAVAACGNVQSNSPGGDASSGSDATGDGAGSRFPSCTGIPGNQATTCGATGDDDCCASLVVSGGSYDRSYDKAGDVNSGDTSSPAKVSTFRLDKYEVTVARFRAFVEAGMGVAAQPPAPSSGAHKNTAGSGWQKAWNSNLASDTPSLKADLLCSTNNPTTSTWTDAPTGSENRPINCLSWYEAMAFCIWDDGYLPTEAEWNYAAAGGSAQRPYPWSKSGTDLTLDTMHASYAVGGDCLGDGMPGCAATDLLPVGSTSEGAGLYGQFDLAGNAFEWTLDWSSPTYPAPCMDCAYLTPPSTGSGTRVRRGGSFKLASTNLRTGNRNNLDPTTLFDGSGVRCARSQ